MNHGARTGTVHSCQTSDSESRLLNRESGVAWRQGASDCVPSTYRLRHIGAMETNVGQLGESAGVIPSKCQTSLEDSTTSESFVSARGVVPSSFRQHTCSRVHSTTSMTVCTRMMPTAQQNHAPTEPPFIVAHRAGRPDSNVTALIDPRLCSRSVRIPTLRASRQSMSLKTRTSVASGCSTIAS